MSRWYAIASLDEARAYFVHPLLGARLRECATVVLATRGRTAEQIFGPIGGFVRVVTQEMSQRGPILVP